MDLGLFGVGIAGALVTVYLAKDEIIPEFRSVFDDSKTDKAISTLQEKSEKTAKEVDTAQAKILDNPSSHQVDNLHIFIRTSQRESAADIKRLQLLESRAMLSQIWRKGMGIVVFVLLGGVVAALMADWVTIEGVTGSLPKVLTALVVGASWTGYMSALGMKSGAKKTDENIENNQKEAAQTIAELKKQVADLAKTPDGQFSKPDKDAQKGLADLTKGTAVFGQSVADQSGIQPTAVTELAQDLLAKLDDADRRLQKGYDITRRKVQRDLKGIL